MEVVHAEDDAPDALRRCPERLVNARYRRGVLGDRGDDHLPRGHDEASGDCSERTHLQDLRCGKARWPRVPADFPLGVGLHCDSSDRIACRSYVLTRPPRKVQGRGRSRAIDDRAISRPQRLPFCSSAQRWLGSGLDRRSWAPTGPSSRRPHQTIERGSSRRLPGQLPADRHSRRDRRHHDVELRSPGGRPRPGSRPPASRDAPAGFPRPPGDSVPIRYPPERDEEPDSASGGSRIRTCEG